MILNLITGAIGILMVAAFLGFMVVWVPAIPLIMIVICVMLLLIYDFVQTVRFGEDADGEVVARRDPLDPALGPLRPRRDVRRARNSNLFAGTEQSGELFGAEPQALLAHGTSWCDLERVLDQVDEDLLDLARIADRARTAACT